MFEVSVIIFTKKQCRFQIFKSILLEVYYDGGVVVVCVISFFKPHQKEASPLFLSGRE